MLVGSGDGVSFGFEYNQPIKSANTNYGLPQEAAADQSDRRYCDSVIGSDTNVPPAVSQYSSLPQDTLQYAGTGPLSQNEFFYEDQSRGRESSDAYSRSSKPYERRNKKKRPPEYYKKIEQEIQAEIQEKMKENSNTYETGTVNWHEECVPDMMDSYGNQIPQYSGNNSQFQYPHSDMSNQMHSHPPKAASHNESHASTDPQSHFTSSGSSHNYQQRFQYDSSVPPQPFNRTHTDFSNPSHLPPNQHEYMGSHSGSHGARYQDSQAFQHGHVDRYESSHRRDIGSYQQVQMNRPEPSSRQGVQTSSEGHMDRHATLQRQNQQTFSHAQIGTNEPLQRQDRQTFPHGQMGRQEQSHKQTFSQGHMEKREPCQRQDVQTFPQQQMDRPAPRQSVRHGPSHFHQQSAQYSQSVSNPQANVSQNVPWQTVPRQEVNRGISPVSTGQSVSVSVKEETGRGISPVGQNVSVQQHGRGISPQSVDVQQRSGISQAPQAVDVQQGRGISPGGYNVNVQQPYRGISPSGQNADVPQHRRGISPAGQSADVQRGRGISPGRYNADIQQQGRGISPMGRKVDVLQQIRGISPVSDIPAGKSDRGISPVGECADGRGISPMGGVDIQQGGRGISPVCDYSSGQSVDIPEGSTDRTIENVASQVSDLKLSHSHGASDSLSGTSQQYMYVPDVHNAALQNTSTVETSRESDANVTHTMEVKSDSLPNKGHHDSTMMPEALNNSEIPQSSAHDSGPSQTLDPDQYPSLGGTSRPVMLTSESSASSNSSHIDQHKNPLQNDSYPIPPSSVPNSSVDPGQGKSSGSVWGAQKSSWASLFSNVDPAKQGYVVSYKPEDQESVTKPPSQTGQQNASNAPQQLVKSVEDPIAKYLGGKIDVLSS